MRLRVRYSKKGKVRFTSHRDVARIWERALRRVGLPMAYSQGFSPRPKMSFGLALSTGHESEAEFLELELSEDEKGETVDWNTERFVDLAAGRRSAHASSRKTTKAAPHTHGRAGQLAQAGLVFRMGDL